MNATAILILTDTPSCRTTTKGLTVVSAPVAEVMTDHPSDCLTCEAFGKLGKYFATLKEGTKIYATGKLRTTHYQNAQGETKIVNYLLLRDFDVLRRPEKDSSETPETKEKLGSPYRSIC